MLPAALGGDAKDTLREHAKFTPSLVIIAMGDSSQGPSQDLSPSMASGMPQGSLGGWMAERDGSCKPSVSIGMAASTAAARASGLQVGWTPWA